MLNIKITKKTTIFTVTVNYFNKWLKSVVKWNILFVAVQICIGITFIYHFMNWIQPIWIIPVGQSSKEEKKKKKKIRKSRICLYFTVFNWSEGSDINQNLKTQSFKWQLLPEIQMKPTDQQTNNGFLFLFYSVQIKPVLWWRLTK